MRCIAGPSSEWTPPICTQIDHLREFRLSGAPPRNYKKHRPTVPARPIDPVDSAMWEDELWLLAYWKNPNPELSLSALIKAPSRKISLQSLSKL
jgi:hypothetical protein